MILDLRYAAGLPVNAGAIIGLGLGLYQLVFAPKPGLPWGMALFQAGGLMFFGAIASMLYVLPNVSAAALSNRLASNEPWPVYCLSFTLAFLAAFWIQGRLLDKWLRGLGGMRIDFTDPKLLAMIAADIALCLVVAAYVSMRTAR